MSHMERVYSVLLVSAAEQLNQVLKGLMSAAPFELVKSTNNAFEIVTINTDYIPLKSLQLIIEWIKTEDIR